MSEIEYKATTALLVVDMQNDFADPDGSLFVEGGDTIIDTINAEIGAATRADGFVVYTQDWHPAQTPHFDIHGGVWPVHCVRDTWGAEFSPMLVVDGPVVRKGSNGEDGYSGFTMRDPESGEQTPTELDGLLRERGIESVVVVGLALDVCVKATATDALDNGYSVTLLGDAVRAVNIDPCDGPQAITELLEMGCRILP